MPLFKCDFLSSYMGSPGHWNEKSLVMVEDSSSVRKDNKSHSESLIDILIKT